MTLVETPHSPEAAFATTQRWSEYTDEQHQVWQLLYRRRIRELAGTASHIFLAGVKSIGLDEHRVPELDAVNGRLAALTGWRAVPVSGFIPATEFFQCLALRRFPTTVTVRPREQLEYIEEPDIFHDVFGHVPLHSHPIFADFLQRFGEAAAKVSDPTDMTRMSRLFWFTVEFGLVREAGKIKIYGSGLISSTADAANALGPQCDRREFDLDAVMQQAFEIDRLQDVLFVIESYDELFEAVERL